MKMFGFLFLLSSFCWCTVHSQDFFGFISQPSDKTCVVGGRVTFSCQPAQNEGNVSWRINDKRPMGSNTSTVQVGGEYRLIISNCYSDWNGYHIWCVIATVEREVSSNMALLSIKPSALHFFQKNTREIVSFIIGLCAAAVVIFVCSCCVCACYRYRCSKKREYHPRQFRGARQRRTNKSGRASLVDYFRSDSVSSLSMQDHKKAERQQLASERAVALEAVQHNLPKDYELVKDLPDIGSRVQKYWFKVCHSEEKRDMILTRSPVSEKCKLSLGESDVDKSHVHTLNTMMTTLQVSYGHLQPVHKILPDPSDKNFIFIIQPLIDKGSLKDMIYGTSDLCTSLEKASLVDIAWSHKYRGTAGPLPTDTISSYGRQILEAMEFLYSLGFPPLGHVHTGNIFVEGDVCRLGGYENTLLGYRTPLYDIIEEYNNLESIDIIMFGHVIYEMSIGRALPVTRLVPTEEDLRCVGDQRCKQILKYIFAAKRNGCFIHTIKEILAHPFFKRESEGDMKELLRLVSDDMDLSCGDGGGAGAGVLGSVGAVFRGVFHGKTRKTGKPHGANQVTVKENFSDELQQPLIV